MDRDALKDIFDQQADTYDQKWSRVAAFRDGLHLLVGSVFAGLPARARVLCVGAGTGAEIASLAARFPGWRFTAVEPAGRMLAACRRRADAAGIADRCTFHEGYLETLPPGAPHDAATCLLVSQFLLDRQARSDFFRAIAQRLRPGGLLANADLSADVDAPGYPALLQAWLHAIAAPDLSPESIERMCVAYRRDVAVLPQADVEALLVAGGFEAPVAFYQAGLMRAWCATRAR